MKISTKKIFVYLFIISISFGVISNLFGAIPIMASLLALAVFRGGTLKVNKKLFLAIGAMFIFIAGKVIRLEDYVPISDYHSIYTVIQNVIYVCGGLLLLNIACKKEDFESKDVICLFNICYYISVCLSIVIISIKGRNIYREYVQEGGILLAPQYFLYYAMGFVCLYTYFIIKSRKNRIKNILLLGINLLYIVMANYTTQLLFALIGMVFIILIHYSKTLSRMLVVIAMTAVIFVICAPSIAGLIITVNDHFFSENATLYTRINDVAKIINGEQDDTVAFKVRKELIDRSMDVYRDSWLIGIDFNEYNVKDQGVNVGGHTQWFDDLARFGTIGVLLWGATIWFGLKIVLVGERKLTEYEKIYLLLYVMYGFFNPFITIQFMCMTFGLMRIENKENSMLEKAKK